MANNFDGLGVGFEVDDNDSSKKVDGLTSSFTDLWGTLKKVGSTVPRVGRGMSRGLSKFSAAGARSVGMVTTAVGGLIDKAMDPQLDSAYASMYAGFNKEFSALTAGMKDTETGLLKSRKRIGGIAHGMGEDMTQAAQNWLAFEQRGVELDKILGTKGLTGTMKSMIKVTSVFGMEGRQLANVAASLKHSYDFTDDAVGALGDKIVAVGREFNMGKEAMQAWPNIMQTLNKELADFGEEMTPEKLDKMTTSLVQLGGGFKQALGVDPAEAMELATQAFSTLASERKNIINMARGMGGEFGEMAKGMMEAGDDVGSIFKQMMEGDPLKFMDMLREMGKEAEKRGGQSGIAFQRLNAVINNTLGPDVSFAMKGNWDKVTETMAGIPEVLQGSRGTLKTIAKDHWKTSLTAGDAWEMMVNNMKAKVFKLSNKEIKGWQKNMKAGFQESFKTVKAFADDKGPLGEMTRKLLAVQRVGFSAFLPSLGALGPMIGGITTEALPMLTAMGSMGVRFSDLGKIAGVGGGAYLLFKTLTEGPEAVVDKFDKMRHSLVDIATTKIFTGEANKGIRTFIEEANEDLDNLGFFETVKKNIEKVPWDDVWDTVWEKVGKVTDFAGDILKDIPWEEMAATAVEWIGKAVQALPTGIWNGLFGGEDSKSEATDVATGILTDAITGAVKAMKGIAKGALKGLWNSVFDPDSLQNTFKNILKVSAVGFGALTILSKKFRSKVGSGLWNFMKKGYSGGSRGVADVYGAGFAHMMPGFGPDPSTMGARRPPMPAPHPGAFQWGGGAKPPPIPTDRSSYYRRQLAAQQRLSGGAMLPQGFQDPQMALGPGGLVPAHGLEAPKQKRKGFFGRMKDKVKAGGAKLKGKAGGRMRGAGQMLRGVGGFGGIMAIGGLFEGIQQMSTRTENIAKATMSNILTEEEKFLYKTEETFLGVTNTIDSMFLGLPSMIGGALGISEEDVTGFYHHMVGSFESGINYAVEMFKFLGRSAEKIYDNMSARAEGLIANLVYGFKSFKADAMSVFYHIGESVHRQFSDLGAQLMYPFDWLSFKLKGWMADIIETIFGKPGENNMITNTLKSVLGEDAVKGMQLVSKGVRMEQKAYLEGEKDFDAAWDKKDKRRKKSVDELWAGKQREVDDSRKEALNELETVMESVDKRTAASGLKAISKDLTDTVDKASKYSDDRARDAQENIDKMAKARSELEAQERRSQFEVLEGGKEEEEKEKKKRRKKKRPKTKMEEVEGKLSGGGDKKKGRPSEVMSNEDRAKASAGASPVDVAKILEENKRQVAATTASMNELAKAVAANSNRPIKVIAELDGRKVGESIERNNRKKVRGM